MQSKQCLKTTTLSKSQNNIDNFYIETCGSGSITELADVKSKLGIDHLLKTGHTTCAIGTQTCKFLKQRTAERQGHNVQCSCVDLSTEIESLKLDIRISESRPAGNLQSNLMNRRLINFLMS